MEGLSHEFFTNHDLTAVESYFFAPSQAHNAEELFRTSLSYFKSPNPVFSCLIVDNILEKAK